MNNASLTLLGDIDGQSAFSSSCESLSSRAQSECRSQFESWLLDIEGRLEDGNDGTLKLQGSLMGWRDGVLVVNFSDELVTFLRDVRQLSELGFEFPKPRGSKSRDRSNEKKSILEIAYDAEKYYRYGILLKKTANFYNSISDQIIDVQEQLLLDSLSAFVEIVSCRSSKGAGSKGSDGDVSWSNPAECESYIRTLQEAAEKLSSENRWLRRVHENLTAQTLSLMGIDLLRQTDLWKTKWRCIKDKMATVRARYSEKNCASWILHWYTRY